MSSNILEAIDGLIGAVNGLIVVQSQTVSIDCGCNVGQGPDNEAGEGEGEPPGPIGTIIYDVPSPIDDRKCKAANYIVGWLVFDVYQDILIAHNIKELAGIGLVLALGIVGSLIGLTGGPAGSLIGAVAGLLIGAISALIGAEIDIDLSQEVMENERQALVCALYEAPNVTTARENFEQVLIDEGQLSTAEIAFIRLWLPNALLNVLFFEIVSPFDSAIFFDGYEPEIDCAGCGPAITDWVIAPSGTYQSFTSATGFMATGSIDQTGNNFVLNSVLGSDGVNSIYIISLIVEGFRLSQLGYLNLMTDPSPVADGVFTVVAGLPISAQGAHGRAVGFCGASITSAGIGGNSTVNDRVFLQWWHTAPNGPFSLTLKINTPVNVC
jgi:hypothetical protein